MKTLSRHTNVCAWFICLALMFTGTASAISMASGNHSAMGHHSTHHSTDNSSHLTAHPSKTGSHVAMGSHASHSMHTSPSMDIMTMDSDHSDHSNISDEDCADHSSCVAECAAHCTTGAISGGQALTAISLMALHVPSADNSPNSVVISGLYKPPRTLH